MFASFANITTYGVEWCLYAIYFRQEYQWSGAWTGFAQMIGDLLGASVLGLSTVRAVTAFTSQAKLPRPVRALLRPPYSLTVGCLANAAFLVLLAQDHFVISLSGQVCMGTAYVFNEQFLQEMLLVYARGDHEHYRKFAAVHFSAFTTGCALCATVAFALHGAGGFALAFYATAGFSGAVGLVFAAYFAWRLAPTSVGWLGSLRDAEEEIYLQRAHGKAAGPATKPGQLQAVRTVACAVSHVEEAAHRKCAGQGGEEQSV